MFPAGSAFSIGELAVLPWSPAPVLPLLEPENINGPDPHRRCPVGRGGLLSATSSPEWLLPPAGPAFDGGRDLPDLEDDDEDAARAHSGDTGDPRSAKTFALASGLSLTSSSWSDSASALRRIRSASDIARISTRRLSNAAACALQLARPLLPSPASA
jgi:hypothetical protein